MHVGADGGDRAALPTGQVLGQQRRGGRLAPVLTQPDHLAMHDVRQDRPEPLAFAALNFIEPDVPRLAFDARAIPLGEECVLGATRLPPAHAVPDGRVTGRHRLTVDADLLSQPSRDARLRIGELDPLGADAAVATDDPALAIEERHVMRRPGQVVPGSIAGRPHASGAPPTAAARVAPDAAPLNPNHQPAVRFFLHHHHAKSRQTENPRTIALRSHLSSPLLVANQERRPPNFRMAKWDRVFASRPLSHSGTIYSARGCRFIPSGWAILSVRTDG
jgi:hypothetical protein